MSCSRVIRPGPVAGVAVAGPVAVVEVAEGEDGIVAFEPWSSEIIRSGGGHATQPPPERMSWTGSSRWAIATGSGAPSVT
jgi:hypothetical protein